MCTLNEGNYAVETEIRYYALIMNLSIVRNRDAICAVVRSFSFSASIDMYKLQGKCCCESKGMGCGGVGVRV